MRFMIIVKAQGFRSGHHAKRAIAGWGWAPPQFKRRTGEILG